MIYTNREAIIELATCNREIEELSNITRNVEKYGSGHLSTQAEKETEDILRRYYHVHKYLEETFGDPTDE